MDEVLEQFMQETYERLRSIEDRQRAYGMHDPECPRLQDEQAQQGTDVYIKARACSCWLAT